MSKRGRGIEKNYPLPDFIAKLRRRFEIQIAGERVYVPARATFNIEHERSGGEEEVEFQIKWGKE